MQTYIGGKAKCTTYWGLFIFLEGMFYTLAYGIIVGPQLYVYSILWRMPAPMQGVFYQSLSTATIATV